MAFRGRHGGSLVNHGGGGPGCRRGGRLRGLFSGAHSPARVAGHVLLHSPVCPLSLGRRPHCAQAPGLLCPCTALPPRERPPGTQRDEGRGHGVSISMWGRLGPALNPSRRLRSQHGGLRLHLSPPAPLPAQRGLATCPGTHSIPGKAQIHTPSVCRLPVSSEALTRTPDRVRSPIPSLRASTRPGTGREPRQAAQRPVQTELRPGRAPRADVGTGAPAPEASDSRFLLPLPVWAPGGPRWD